MELKSNTESLSSLYQKLSDNQKLLVKTASIIFILSIIYKYGYVLGKVFYNSMH